MPAPRTAARRRTLAAAVVATAAVLGAAIVATAPAGSSPAPPAPAAAPARSTPPERPYSVTLLSGDRVRVRPLGGDRFATTVTRGPGRDRMPFTTVRTRDGLLVVPADAAPLLAADRLDRRLFDVLALRRFGYTDGQRADLPVMVTSTGPVARVPAARAGAATVQVFPGLGVRRDRVAKAAAGTFWTATRRAARTEKVWLVGKRRLLLDRSVGQIGAPTAWTAGLTGRGVTVAVLDGGYDPTHPDLAGVVAVAKDFTGSAEGVRDLDGHGTHVASIVAGRGTASNGRYTGVAKGARLAIGKVCEDDCSEDAILAGMEWAATSTGARVVNLSLGGPSAGADDPLEAAVQRLTARTGVLFVCSAGNDGGAETVASPAAAPAALAVGSVGRTDAVSDFSSRGPVVDPDRRGPYLAKPDITAPGEDIVAARAAGTDLGEPVGAGYTRLSGTSMAAPHVAGAAAILLQQHPTWTAGRLRAALTSTAAPSPGATVYDQGAGRVDVARAVTTPLTADAGTLDLGYQRWPNAGAAPVVRTLTYGNRGRAPLTVTLRSRLDGPAGPAPAGALTLDRTTVTIAPGGTARVTLTYRPAAVPPGLYGGRVTAVAGRARAVTALGGFREPESYDTTITAIDRAGRAGTLDGFLVDRRTGRDEQLSFTGSQLRRLPAGRHTIAATLTDAGDPAVQTVTVREFTVRGPGTVALDARQGRAVRTALDRPDAVPGGAVDLEVGVRVGGITRGLGASGPVGAVRAVPSPARPGVASYLTGYFVRGGSGPRHPTPWVYHVARTDGGIPADLTYRFRRSAFEAVRETYLRQGTEEFRGSAVALLPDAPAPRVWTVPLDGARARTSYLLGGVDWVRSVEFGPEGADPTGFLDSEILSAVAGRTAEDRWNAAVLGPAFRDAGSGPIGWLDGGFFGPVEMFSDADGHVGPGGNGAGVTGTLRVLRDGKQVSSSADPLFLDAPVPAAPADYRIEVDVRRALPWTSLSSRQTLAWTFRSGRPGGTGFAVLPLGVVRFAPPVDARDRAPRGRAVDVPVRYERAPGAAPAGLRTLSVQVSYDGGRTWRDAPLAGSGDARTARLTHPAAAGPVALRARAVDTAGGTVEQTILGAYTTV